MLFGKVSVWIFCSFFNWLVRFLPAGFRSSLHSEYQSLMKRYFANISCHSVIFFILLIVSSTGKNLMNSKLCSSYCGTGEMNLTNIHEDQGWSLTSLSGLGIQCFCELWCMSQTWLWCRPAAVAPTNPLAWASPCATGVALKSKQNKTKQTNKKNWGKKKSKLFIFYGYHVKIFFVKP